MKSLIKVILILACVFASTFLIAKLSGFLSLESIQSFFDSIKSSSPLFIGSLIAALLFADLFIAVPTLSICILAGFFLGIYNGFIFSLLGVYLAGLGGYFISSIYGTRVLYLILKSDAQRDELTQSFKKYGFVMILLSRAMPILPEVVACLSGVTRMSFLKFFMAWSISSIPYVAIAVYAGSISSLDNPKPAIFTMIGLTSFFSICWFLFRLKLKSCNITRTVD
jgi:uncharacterized membrane protein YdjX (TVP38/TMEM64 family)